MRITVQAETKASLASLWSAATTPEAIQVWNAATDDWHCPSAEVDLRVGGKMKSRMESIDGRRGFDFTATFTAIEPHQRLEYQLSDGRTVELTMKEKEQLVHVQQTFDAEGDIDPEQQKIGWQSLMDSFVSFAEANTK